MRTTVGVSGIHALIYSKQAERVRAFLRDVLEWRSVDAGEGWPIFAAPPLEVAVHETEDPPEHELYLMCGDIAATVAQLQQRGVTTAPIAERGWGLVTSIDLGDGESLGLYEPRHPSPLTSN